MFGESVYTPLHDPMFAVKSNPTPDQLAQWRRMAMEIAKAGLPLHVHADLHDTIDAFLDQIEAVNKEYPDQEPALGARARQPDQRLAARAHEEAGDVCRRASVGGHQRRHHARRVSATAPYDMPPLATIQKSGIVWGFGSDGSAANQILPFTTLRFAVTGKMAGGMKVIRQTISREDALIAHTRKNAYLVFQENNLARSSRASWPTWWCSIATT